MVQTGQSSTKSSPAPAGEDKLLKDIKEVASSITRKIAELDPQEVRSKAEKFGRDARHYAEETVQEASDVKASVEAAILRKPLQAVAIAAAAGYVLHSLLGRK